MKNLFLLFTFFLVGCATPKTFQAIDGSKADATVKLAYQYGLFEQPIVDWKLADTTAKKHCMAWGYKNVERFGGTQNACLSYSDSGSCLTTQVSMTYQCTEK